MENKKVLIDRDELLEIFKRNLEVTQETIEDEEKQGRYPSFLKGKLDGIKFCINALEWESWDNRDGGEK